MKLTVDRKLLADEVRILASVAPKRAVEWAGYILAEASEQGQLTCRATDGHVGIIVTLPAQVEEPGNRIIPVGPLAYALGHLPDQHVRMEIEQERGRLIVAGEAGDYRMACLQGIDYPEVIVPEPDGPCIVKTSDLINELGHVTHVAEMSEKDWLASVYFEFEPGALIMTATTGSILGHTRVGAIFDGGKGQAVVPIESVRVLEDILDDLNSSVQLWRDDKKLYASVGHRKMSSVLVEYEYPNYRAVLDRALKREQTWAVSVRREDIYGALALAMVFKDSGNPDKKTAAYAHMSLADRLEMRAVDDFKDSKVEVRLTVSTVENSGRGEIWLRLPYLAASVRPAHAENIRILAVDQREPVIICPDSDMATIMLVMPIIPHR